MDRSAVPAHKWRVFFHEMVHAALDDAGLSNLLSADAVESICDAIATARLQELRGQLGLDP
jgi:hypothetical protein